MSPLKALTTDIVRNEVRCETRTGDTPRNRRARQRLDPSDILLITPESLALPPSYPDATRMFAGLRRVVVDELHALANAKRGQLLARGLARLARLATPRFIGLSATVNQRDALLGYLGMGDCAGSARSNVNLAFRWKPKNFTLLVMYLTGWIGAARL